MPDLKSDALVFFGATGDLALKIGARVLVLANEVTVHLYPPKTWGLREASSILLDGQIWHDPVIAGKS